jgi:RNA polymerase sigma factor (sigma-70 family)
MARNQLGTVLDFIRAALGARASGDTTDADLLERFSALRDEAAFTVIFERYGALVLSVCRRVLSNAEDADDAFQAAFLVLFRKARSIRKSASLASWLHGVAYRVSLEARTRAGRRQTHVKRAESMGQADPADEAGARELRSILDQELEQLPEKYRAPLVLHYLAGKTKEETAQQLGWSEGTVSGRLARARDLLRSRLTRRGLALSGSALSAALSQEAAVASVSSVLASSTVSLVTLCAVGEAAAGARAARILALTERVVHTMFLTKLKIATAVLLVAAAVGLGAGGLFYQAQADPPEDRPQPQPPTASAAGTLQDQPAPVKKAGAIFRVPDSYTLAVALTADGKLLARGGADNTVDLWDVASGKKLHTLKGHTVPILRVAFSPDGKTLASITGSWLPDEVRGEVKVWDVVSGKERASLNGHPTRMLSLAFSPDGKTLASAAGTVKLWDVDTGKEKLELKLGERELPWSLAFSPDGKTLATGSGLGPMHLAPGSVFLWDVATGKQKATLPGHANSITWVGFAPDGKTLASASCGSYDQKQKPLPGEIKLWDIATAKERATLPIRTPTPLQFFDLAFSADGKTLISALWSFGEKENEGGLAVEQWDLATGKAKASFWAPFNPFNSGGPPGAGTNAGIFFAALSGNGKTVAWGGAEGQGRMITGTAHVWDVQSLATSPPKLPKEPERPAAKKPLPEQADGTFRLMLPTQATFLEAGEAKAVSLSIKRGKNFDEDVTITFADTDVPKGVTFDPSKPVMIHGDTEAIFTIKAANDAALGDFAIKITARTTNWGASDQFNLSVVPKGAVIARDKSGRPVVRRRHLRRSRDPFTGTFDFSMAADEIARDGKVVSVAGGKLVMRSEDGTQYNYALAANPQISYENAACKLEDLRPGMVVRVTAKKESQQRATRIEAVDRYGAFMAEYEEQERLRKRDQ